MQFLSHYSEDDIEIFISLIVEPFKCYKGNLRWLFFNNNVVFFVLFCFFLQLALIDSSRHCADSAIKLFTMFPKNYTSFILIPFHLKLFSVDYHRNIANKFIIHIFLSAIWLPYDQLWVIIDLFVLASSRNPSMAKLFDCFSLELSSERKYLWKAVTFLRT